MSSMPKVAALALFILLVAGSAAMAEWVIMRPGDVGAEREFFAALLKQERSSCGQCKYRMSEFYIGRFDINDDGQYELFVVFSHSTACGTAGCTNPIYRKREGGWEKIGELDGGFFCEPGHNRFMYVEVDDERIGGHRTLLGAEFGLRWDSHPITGDFGYFDYFCLTEHCIRHWEADRDEPYTKSRATIAPREAQCRTESESPVRTPKRQRR